MSVNSRCELLNVHLYVSEKKMETPRSQRFDGFRCGYELPGSKCKMQILQELCDVGYWDSKGIKSADEAIRYLWDQGLYEQWEVEWALQWGEQENVTPMPYRIGVESVNGNQRLVRTYLSKTEWDIGQMENPNGVPTRLLSAQLF